MQTKISKWGNSLAIRIPAALAAEVWISCGDSVELRTENGVMVIEPTKKRVPTLDELLDRLDPETLHGEIDWGMPKGNEAW